MARFSRQHYRMVSPATPTAAQVEQTRHEQKAGEWAVRDRELRFPALTAENAQAAIDYQNARQRYWESLPVGSLIEQWASSRAVARANEWR